MRPKISTWKTLLPIALILGVSTLGLYFLRQTSTNSNSTASVVLEEGAHYPDFTLWDPSGGSKKVSSIQAKVYFVNFWASWCDACLIEMPSIVKLMRDYRSKGLEVIAINVDDEPLKIIPRMTQQFNFNFPIYIDKDQTLAELFNVSALPLTVLLDKNRRVLMIETGETDWNDPKLRTQLEKWLSS